MGNAHGDHDDEDRTVATATATAEGTEALPDLNPWREVGWIFRDGDCVAIARDGGEGAAPYVLAD
jgi:hypothetical protein